MSCTATLSHATTPASAGQRLSVVVVTVVVPTAVVVVPVTPTPVTLAVVVVPVAVVVLPVAVVAAAVTVVIVVSGEVAPGGVAEVVVADRGHALVLAVVHGLVGLRGNDEHRRGRDRRIGHVALGARQQADAPVGERHVGPPPCR